MVFVKIYLFGAVCEYCKKQLKAHQFVYMECFGKAGDQGDLNSNTGYLNFYHSECWGKVLESFTSEKLEKQLSKEIGRADKYQNLYEDLRSKIKIMSKEELLQLIGE